MAKLNADDKLRIYRFFIEDLHLKGTQLYTYAVLYRDSGEGAHECKIDYEQIMGWTRLKTIKSAKNNIRELLMKGLIEISRREHEEVYINICK